MPEHCIESKSLGLQLRGDNLRSFESEDRMFFVYIADLLWGPGLPVAQKRPELLVFKDDRELLGLLFPMISFSPSFLN